MTWLIEIGDRLRDAVSHWLPFYRSLGILLSVALVSAMICQNPLRNSIPPVHVGEIVKRNVKAPQSLRIVDEDLSEKKRAAAAEQVLDVFDYDPQSLGAELDTLNRAFQALHAPLQPGRSLAKTRANFEETLKITLSDEEWKLLRDPSRQAALRRVLERTIVDLQDYWIVDDTNNPQKLEISVRDLRSNEELRITRRTSQKKIMTKEQIRDFVLNEKGIRVFPAALRERVAHLTSKIVEPNLVSNPIETKARQDEARSKVESSWVEIAEGEMIAREGQRIDHRTALLLKSVREIEAKSTDFMTTLIFALLLALLMSLFYGIGRRNFRKFKLSLRDQIVIGGFFVTSLIFVSGFEHLFAAAKSQSIAGLSVRLLIPLAFSGMTLRLITSMEIVTFFSILLCTAVGWMFKDPFMALICLCVALSGAARMRHISQRLDVFKAGFYAAIVQSFLVLMGLGLGYIESPGFESPITNGFAAVLLSLGSGLISSTMVLGMQPLMEYLGYTTDLRLMELSSTNHPLLKDLIIKAPGTYFHSFTVSQLAEKAAEAIHGNALFARVASLYHDIGKIKKPHYFIENIKGENKHDRLVPTMSALIISNHVKDGIELAYEYKLPQSIIEIIPQHHGTSLMSYFFDKAKKQTEDEPVDEHDFRYAGPKPQTREGAIILLADAVEATAKSLQNKTPEQLRMVVHSTIQRFFIDGQLDECEVSLKDLTAIGNAFLQVLQGVYHQRIDYPHLKEAQRETTSVDFIPTITKH